jgi:glycosyltransferase involved in cell wall biosynthesis
VSRLPSADFPNLISVVLCCHNGARTLADQLSALAKQDYTGSWELIFVDDGSTDKSVSIAESWSDRLPIRIVPTGQPGDPVGLASARNIGGNAARGDVLLFCDDDDVADKAWISAFAHSARASAAFGGFNEEDLLNDPSVRGWRYPWTPGRLPIAFGMVQIPVGNNSGVWTSAFREVEGFDAEFSQFGSGEEVDFFWRVQLAGYDVRYVPTAIMHVRHRNSLKALVRQSYRYGLSNAVLYRRFRHLGLRRTSGRETLAVMARIARGIPGALAVRRKRGAWLRMTSYACGQAVGSIRNRVWRVD